MNREEIGQYMFDMVIREMRRQNAIIEEACEKSLVTGTMGVLAVYEGATLIGAAPDPDVPWGTIRRIQNPKPVSRNPF